MAPTPPDHTHAQKHLARRHRAFAELIERIGPCTLRADPNAFSVLVRAVIWQQISTRAAETIGAKFLSLCPGGEPTPDVVHALGDDHLRACGMSGAKRRYVRAITDAFRGGAIDPAALAAADDAAVSRALLPITGVGPWTVQMYLIFGLGRPDVLPTGDLGLRMGAADEFGLAEPPTPKQLEALAEPWRPYRTVATWYLWRSRGGVPQS